VPGVLMRALTKKPQSALLSRLSSALLLACPLLLLASQQAGTSEKRMKPLSHEEVAQVWVGLSEDELYLVRMRLDKSGVGQVSYAFADDRPRGFRVRSWTYRDDRISVPLEAADDSPLEVPVLSGVVAGTAMRLTMKGTNWSRQVELRLEAPLELKWTQVKEEMARLAQ